MKSGYITGIVETGTVCVAGGLAQRWADKRSGHSAQARPPRRLPLVGGCRQGGAVGETLILVPTEEHQQQQRLRQHRHGSEPQLQHPLLQQRQQQQMQPREQLPPQVQVPSRGDGQLASPQHRAMAATGRVNRPVIPIVGPSSAERVTTLLSVLMLPYVCERRSSSRGTPHVSWQIRPRKSDCATDR